MAAPRRVMTAFAVHRLTSIDLKLKPLVRLLVTVTVLAILPVFSSEATAGTAELQFDSWTTENGLPQNSVNDRQWAVSGRTARRTPRCRRPAST